MSLVLLHANRRLLPRAPPSLGARNRCRGDTDISTEKWSIAAEANTLILLPLSGHSGRGWTCCWLDPVANDPGCVKTLRGITVPGILGPVVMRRAKKHKNLSSARHDDQIGFRFHTAKTLKRHQQRPSVSLRISSQRTRDNVIAAAFPLVTCSGYVKCDTYDSARSSAGPVCRLKLSAQLIRPT